MCPWPALEKLRQLPYQLSRSDYGISQLKNQIQTDEITADEEDYELNVRFQYPPVRV